MLLQYDTPLNDDSEKCQGNFHPFDEVEEDEKLLILKRVFKDNEECEPGTLICDHHLYILGMYYR